GRPALRGGDARIRGVLPHGLSSVACATRARRAGLTYAPRHQLAGELIVAEQSDVLPCWPRCTGMGWCTGTTIRALEASEPLRYGDVGHARSEYLLLTHGAHDFRMSRCLHIAIRGAKGT